MDKREQASFSLNSSTSLMLGKLAQLEDMIAVATAQAEELLVDIAQVVEK